VFTPALCGVQYFQHVIVLGFSSRLAQLILGLRPLVAASQARVAKLASAASHRRFVSLELMGGAA
jgi:hypothetical protein